MRITNRGPVQNDVMVPIRTAWFDHKCFRTVTVMECNKDIRSVQHGMSIVGLRNQTFWWWRPGKPDTWFGSNLFAYSIPIPNRNGQLYSCKSVVSWISQWSASAIVSSHYCESFSCASRLNESMEMIDRSQCKQQPGHRCMRHRFIILPSLSPQPMEDLDRGMVHKLDTSNYPKSLQLIPPHTCDDIYLG